MARKKYKTEAERKAGKAAYNKQYQRTEKAKIARRKYMKQYRQSEKFKSTSRRYQYSKIGKIVAEKNRRNTVLKRGGITLEEYNQMFAKQNGCCAICGKHQSELKNRLAIDHNHETGEIRGLLCTSCNITLGWLEKIEKIDFVARVKTYRKI